MWRLEINFTITTGKDIRLFDLPWVIGNAFQLSFFSLQKTEIDEEKEFDLVGRSWQASPGISVYSNSITAFLLI